MKQISKRNFVSTEILNRMSCIGIKIKELRPDISDISLQSACTPLRQALIVFHLERISKFLIDAF